MRTKDTSHGDGHKQGAAAAQRLRANDNEWKGRSEEPRLALSEDGERIDLVLPIAGHTPVERLRWSTCFGIDKRLITISVSHTVSFCMDFERNSLDGREVGCYLLVWNPRDVI